MDVFSRQVLYFLKCAECETFHVAARSLGVTQSALSLAIKKLEEDWQVVLFHRSRSGIELTEEAKPIYQRLSEVQAQLGRKLRASDSAPETPLLRVGAASHFGTRRLVPCLERNRKAFPKVQLYLGYSLTVYDAVRDGRLDFGFVGWTRTPSDLSYVRLWKDPYKIVGLKSKYPSLAKARSMEDLRAMPWVYLPKPQYDFSKYFDGEKAGFVVGHSAPLHALILQGVGVGPVQMDGFTDAEQRSLVAAPFEPPDSIPDMYLVHRKSCSERLLRWANELVSELRAANK